MIGTNTEYLSLDPWQHLNTVTTDEEISKEQKHPAGPEQRAVTQAGNIWGTLVRGGHEISHQVSQFFWMEPMRLLELSH